MQSTCTHKASWTSRLTSPQKKTLETRTFRSTNLETYPKLRVALGCSTAPLLTTDRLFQRGHPCLRDLHQIRNLILLPNHNNFKHLINSVCHHRTNISQVIALPTFTNLKHQCRACRRHTYPNLRYLLSNSHSHYRPSFQLQKGTLNKHFYHRPAVISSLDLSHLRMSCYLHSVLRLLIRPNRPHNHQRLHRKMTSSLRSQLRRHLTDHQMQQMLRVLTYHFLLLPSARNAMLRGLIRSSILNQTRLLQDLLLQLHEIGMALRRLLNTSQ